MPTKRAPYLAALAVCVVLGALLDFLFNGVLKIIWILIYGPAYIVAAKVLAIQFSRLKPEWPVPPAVAALFAGVLVCHLFCVGHERQVVYALTQTSDSPIILRSSDWPQVLMVSSGKLKQVLAARPSKEGIPVLLHAVMDYGCYRTVKISSVAGVDVQSDPDASWTWRMENRAPMPTDVGPGTEDRSLPWCLIKFYRGSQG